MKWLTITGICLIALALYMYGSHANADEPHVVANEDGTFVVTCTGSQVDIIVAECKAVFWKVCPEGGVVIDAQGSPLDAVPLTLRALIKCKPSEAI